MLSKEDIEAIRAIMKEELKPIQETLNQHTKILEEHTEQLKDIDTSIGMLADWADNVAVITKVPFASGKTSIS